MNLLERSPPSGYSMNMTKTQKDKLKEAIDKQLTTEPQERLDELESAGGGFPEPFQKKESGYGGSGKKGRGFT